MPSPISTIRATKTTEVNTSSLFINSTIREGFLAFKYPKNIMLEKQKPQELSSYKRVFNMYNTCKCR
jgi:hypothetical protein